MPIGLKSDGEHAQVCGRLTATPTRITVGAVFNSTNAALAAGIYNYSSNCGTCVRQAGNAAAEVTAANGFYVPPDEVISFAVGGSSDDYFQSIALSGTGFAWLIKR